MGGGWGAEGRAVPRDVLDYVHLRSISSASPCTIVHSNTMWAAIKSDLEEFVSTAAEETNAAASKVVARPDAASSREAASSWAASALGTAATKASHAAAGGVGAVKGLSGMIGGVVAPVRQRPVQTDHVKNASALLAASEGDEEALGWDDDEDDCQMGELASQSECDAKDTLLALQGQLSRVEKERDALQSEHRKQTAELVELRSKVDELQGAVDRGRTVSPGQDEEVQALREEIASLKLRLDPSQPVDTDDEANEEQLRRYQQEIAQLNIDLSSLQSNYQESQSQLTQSLETYETQLAAKQQQLQSAQSTTQTLQAQLSQMEQRYATAVQEVSDANAKIIQLERQQLQSKDGEISSSSGEKNAINDSFVTAGEDPLSPNVKGLVGGEEEEEDDDWGGDWDDDD